MHHLELSISTSLTSRIFATDFFAASHWLAATNVRKSGARIDAHPHRNLRMNKCRRPSPLPGRLTCSTVHKAVTRTATQLQIMSSEPLVSGPCTQPLKSSAGVEMLVLLPSMLLESGSLTSLSQRSKKAISWTIFGEPIARSTI